MFSVTALLSWSWARRGALEARPVGVEAVEYRLMARVAGRLPDDYHHVKAGKAHRGLPKAFTNEPADAVSTHGIAHALQRRGHAKSRVVES